ncbi:MAG: DNA gyrase subunit A [Calditrichaeota bacterium]|nr:DNA gyrase subunit A [Calditrichota bacterium]
MQGERIIPRPIEDEMRDSYLDYSMSVIVQRALPDVRDGLKPVHRRILYGMNELGLGPGRPYKKSARIVGDVMGKYHPHGDAAIYDALVRMVQTFSMRAPLIDGQGNFGSVDGDSPAAMRYTEARMERLADELLADIEKETVPFTGNYDDTLQEPVVLPAKFPNLLVNGSSGIAVGMATNIPPHNLGEIIDALEALIEDPSLPVVNPEEPERAIFNLRDFRKGLVQGPDFPTGGIIYGIEGVRDYLTTGRGRVTVRAKATVETPKNARERIVVVEIPYQVDKTRLIEKTAELINDKKIEGIADIRDESDRDGMRIVYELKRDAVPEVVLNNLYAHTQLQTTFGVIMLALVGGVPKVIDIKRALEEYLKHRHEVVTKRTEYDLRKAKEREHIFEGLKIAVDNLDEVIEIIRSSKEPSEARSRLMTRFGLSEIQAKEILDMRLARLTGLERQAIIDELRQIKELIFDLEGILGSKERRMMIVKEELLDIKVRYADDRRTEIVPETGSFTIEDMIAEEDMVITVTKTGYIKRFPVSGYRRQRRGGKGLSGHTPREEDAIQHLFVASTHNYILFFTDRGQCHWLKVHEIPSLGRVARGKPIVNLIDIAPGEQIAALVNVAKFDSGHYLLFCTRSGTVKKTPLDAYSNPRRGGIRAISVDADDALTGVDLTDGKCDIVLGASNGKAVRFNESDARPMGRTAAGVIGMRLGPGDRIVGMVVARREGTLMVVSEKGYGKRSPLHEYRLTRRGASGVKAMNTTPITGPLIALMEVTDSDDLLIITSSGIVIRQPVSAIRSIGRVTRGVRLINLNREDGALDTIADISKVVREDDEGETDDALIGLDEEQSGLFGE